MEVTLLYTMKSSSGFPPPSDENPVLATAFKILNNGTSAWLSTHRYNPPHWSCCLPHWLACSLPNMTNKLPIERSLLCWILIQKQRQDGLLSSSCTWDSPVSGAEAFTRLPTQEPACCHHSLHLCTTLLSKKALSHTSDRLSQ